MARRISETQERILANQIRNYFKGNYMILGYDDPNQDFLNDTQYTEKEKEEIVKIYENPDLAETPLFSKIYPHAKLPTYAHKTDACADIYGLNDFVIKGYETKRIQTGIQVNIPPGFELQVRPKSGLSLSGLHISFGTVDESYTGEIQVIVFNSRAGTIRHYAGEKIAQVSLQRVIRMDLEVLSNKSRGGRGFGSTGKQ